MMQPIFEAIKVYPMQKFCIQGLAGVYFISEDGIICDITTNNEADACIYRHAINRGVIVIQQASAIQKHRLKSLFNIGFRYIAKDHDNTTWFFEEEPILIGRVWCMIPHSCEYLSLNALLRSTVNELSGLVNQGECRSIESLIAEVW